MFLIFQERIERGTFVKKKGGVDVIWYNVKYTWILLLIMPTKIRKRPFSYQRTSLL